MPKTANEDKLIQEILSSKSSEHVVSTTLKTDEKVIARVTDGIYRQPGSALRELISNAYDADATEVNIQTDAPRFNKISVQDNGHGMNAEALAHLLFHIGGSAKRSGAKGVQLGITSTDPRKSPNGRNLIGKIGIGLFSVSQLTQTFQIITKRKGESFRTIATVAMKQYSDDPAPDSGDGEIESGKVKIWREKASDTDVHGTTIVLTRIRNQAKETLRSAEFWAAIDQANQDESINIDHQMARPKYHIGRIDNSGKIVRTDNNSGPSLPWLDSDSPREAFQKLVNSVWVEAETNKPRLESLFDYYLQMIWQLSLAIPTDYIEGHPFDLVVKDWAEAFLLSNKPKGKAEALTTPSKSIRHQVTLTDPDDSIGDFSVIIDGLKLARPIKYKNLATTKGALNHPLIFIGKCSENFDGIPRELSGGPLSFEAYLFWTPKVAPVEHQGVLIRINGASGTLFDSTFMKYQIAELTRLRQITCEVFVKEGLDSALNIDRESFNSAHPHAVFITKWIHSALRQLASTQKTLSSKAREKLRGEKKGEALSKIQQIAHQEWEDSPNSDVTPAPKIIFSDDPPQQDSTVDHYKIPKRSNLSSAKISNTQKSRAKQSVIEEKVKAITQVLLAFDLLEGMNEQRREKLIKAIYQILETSEE